MTPANDPTPPDAEELSALCDGEVSDDSARLLVRQWSTDPALRQRWHDYALVGDVLRSTDLADHTLGDSDFVARLRHRMAAEGLTDARPAQAEAVVAIASLARLPAEKFQALAAGVAEELAPHATADGYRLTSTVLIASALRK